MTTSSAEGDLAGDAARAAGGGEEVLDDPDEREAGIGDDHLRRCEPVDRRGDDERRRAGRARRLREALALDVRDVAGRGLIEARHARELTYREADDRTAHRPRNVLQPGDRRRGAAVHARREPFFLSAVFGDAARPSASPPP